MVPELTDLTGLESWTRYIQSLVTYTGDPDLISGFDFDAAATLTVADYLRLLDTAETFLLGFDWSIITAQIPFIESTLISAGVPAATISLALGFLNDFASGDVSFVTEGFDLIRAQLAGYAPDTVLASAIAGDGKIDVGGGTEGTDGDDELTGSGKKDSIDGKGGDDDIDGKGGKDTLKGGAGDDEVNGKGGKDKVYGNAGNDTLKGGNGNDTLKGGAGNDVIDGQNGKDKVYGDKGKDTLEGGNGNDTLKGGGGNDVIDGERGNDTLYGNAGRDEFHFGKNDGNDVAKDFRNNVDTLVLDDALWSADLNKKQVINRFGEQDGDDFVLTFRTGSITLENFDGADLRNDLEIV